MKRVSEILRAATNARWPMYLRNVKQLLRAAEGGFDERRHGFGGLVDLVRACQKEGLVRLERDRRGGLRVFPGATLQRAGFPRDLTAESGATTHDHAEHQQPQPDAEFLAERVEVERGTLRDAGDAIEAVEAEVIDTEPMPTIDPTAELLGTSTRRKRPTRGTPVASAAAKRVPKTTGRKPAASRRAARAKTE